jgi:uncharacterized protein (TIGR03437 family)
VGFVRKYAPGGGELWTRPVDAAGVLAADATGVYVAGPVITKLDPSGNTLWKHPFAAEASKYAFQPVEAVALDATSLYVGGETERALPGQCKAGNGDVFVRKYDTADGTELWTRQFGTSGREFLGGVAVDSTSVYVSGGIGGGPAHGNVFLAKLEKAPTVAATGRPQIWQECVVNAASYAGGGVAPGEIVTIFGQAMGPAELTALRLADDGRLATTLADARILFNGIPAPLVYVSATQSSAIVPYAVAEKSTATVEIEYQGVRSDPLRLPVAATRPGVFTVDESGYGQAAILNADGSFNSAANPADRGSVVVLYLTGEGLIDPASPDGAILGDPLPKPKLPLSVWFEDPATGDGNPAEAIYAGGVLGSVAGLLQVNVRIPSWTRSGSAVLFSVEIAGQPAEWGFSVALR